MNPVFIIVFNNHNQQTLLNASNISFISEAWDGDVKYTRIIFEKDHAFTSTNTMDEIHEMINKAMGK